MKRYIKSANNIKSHIVLNTLEDVRDLYTKYFDATRTNYIRHDDMGYHSHIIEVPNDDLLYKLYIEDKNKDGDDVGRDWPSDFLMAIRYWGTPSSYKQIKNRLSKLITIYDGVDFRPPYDIVEALATQIESSKLEPYPISIEIKPTSVFIRYRFTKTQLKGLDLAQINFDTDNYIESLKSLPLVGRIDTEHAHITDDLLTKPNLKTYYIKVVPKANTEVDY